jgi:hypothetical protein
MELELICPKEDCYVRLEQDGLANWQKDSVSIPCLCPHCRTAVILKLGAEVKGRIPK